MSAKTAVRKKPAGVIELTIMNKIKNLVETKGIYHHLARCSRGLAKDIILAQKRWALISQNTNHLLLWLFQHLHGCKQE